MILNILYLGIKLIGVFCVMFCLTGMCLQILRWYKKKKNV